MDQQWLQRIVDNLFQNVLRHAHEGKYVGVQSERVAGGLMVNITDHGPGLKALSKASGAHVGLSIVRVMAEKMDIRFSITSDEHGTKATLFFPELLYSKNG
ncbi:ATP-binding protein [Bacillaceae bacterium SIJ1]|uniref:ATP-binding protein n=1 Tax=Litoribacterium kuwaitense TaxID=1398745 RepID=UPI0013EC540F|nr:ATP-binding protein [Litoribacterium kuwaitense]NGP43860.1 ATP-binding protein [Litoribacterium kuwaitense]